MSRTRCVPKPGLCAAGTLQQRHGAVEALRRMLEVRQTAPIGKEQDGRRAIRNESSPRNGASAQVDGE
jgi:hypothetical protein